MLNICPHKTIWKSMQLTSIPYFDRISGDFKNISFINQQKMQYKGTRFLFNLSKLILDFIYQFFDSVHFSEILFFQSFWIWFLFHQVLNCSCILACSFCLQMVSVEDSGEKEWQGWLVNSTLLKWLERKYSHFSEEIFLCRPFYNLN